MKTYTADEVDEMIGRALAREREQRKPFVGLTNEERVELIRQVPHLTIGGLLAVEAKIKEKTHD